MSATVIFSAIGFAVVALIALAAVLYALLWLYFNLIDERFGLIFFRPSVRRLSIASWHESRLIREGERGDEEVTNWPADDWPVGPRPFYLSYRVGKRRLFILAGRLGEHRSRSIEGRHP